MTNLHGTCVAFGAVGVLLRGAPGAGKSTLALQLMDTPGLGLGRKMLVARLVADDQVLLHKRGRSVMAAPPPVLAGLMEIRGLGLVRVSHRKSAAIRLVVDLVAPEEVPRLPEAESMRVELLGLALPRLVVAQRLAAAPAIIRAALARLI